MDRYSSRNLTHAFTLIELLMVVAVIALLAGIAVPNFLEAQTRSKIARSRTDQSTLRLAIHSYYSDFQAYPPNHPETMRWVLNFDEAKATEAAKRDGHYDPFGGMAFGESTMLPYPMANVQTSTADGPSTRTQRQQEFYDRFGNTEKFMWQIQLEYTPDFALTAWDLVPVTTPIAYTDRTLPADSFHINRGWGYRYLNYTNFPESTPESLKAHGFIIIGVGPGHASLNLNPREHDWMQYDPTNGTVSRGVIRTKGIEQQSTFEPHGLK